MARLIYAAITSLDGYMSDLSDPDADAEWSVPTREVFSAVLDLERPIGTYLYGRRMYETMALWETAHLDAGAPAFTPGLLDLERDFAALWRAADKIVFSTTLTRASTPRTRIERGVDPAEIRRLKAASERDLTVGGPRLAAAMIRANLVDDFHVFVHPITVGRGNPWLPQEVRMSLELVAEQRLGEVVHLHYRI